MQVCEPSIFTSSCGALVKLGWSIQVCEPYWFWSFCCEGKVKLCWSMQVCEPFFSSGVCKPVNISTAKSGRGFVSLSYLYFPWALCRFLSRSECQKLCFGFLLILPYINRKFSWSTDSRICINCWAFRPTISVKLKVSMAIVRVNFLYNAVNIPKK
jgi:hypothetical protein